MAEPARRSGAAMSGSLFMLTHPDGAIALLNDAAFEIGPTAAALARRFGLPHRAIDGAWALPDAGYRGVRRGGFYAVMDTGPIGPDHQPGHGHADLLSLEISRSGERVVTDTGTMTYDAGPGRDHDRGTAAHSTVEIDGRDQCELWGAFRCGRRPRARGSTRELAGGIVELSGEYMGPGRGMQKVWHRRSAAVGTEGIAFTDTLVAAGEHRATMRLHLAPGLAVHRRGREMVLARQGRELARVRSRDVELELASSPYHPEFGLELVRSCLAAEIAFCDRAEIHWEIAMGARC
jgi:uncharacterized heparinase superfamily protein